MNTLKLRSIGLDLTSRCNGNCLFCPFHGIEGTISKGAEIPLEHFLRLVEDLATLSPKPVVKLAGSGEPTIYRGFDQLINKLRHLDMPTRLITNGTTLKDKAKSLKHLIGLVVSIHGDENIHDTLTKKRGAFTKAVAGIKFFRELSDTEVIINMVITPQNYNNLIQYASFGDSLGAKMRFQHMKFVSGNARLGSINIVQLWSQLGMIRQRFPDTIFEPEMNLDELKSYYEISTLYILNPFECFRVHSDLPIRFDGVVIACDGSVLGDIKEQSILDIAFGKSRHTFVKGVIQSANSDKGLPDYCSRCCYNSKQHITRYQTCK
ncbi:radical SAM protein [Desulfosediminicola ganghwensis]|uniref:radical SAM protein n=1 Tax=Desulfosediminicola ganghwensis TaxID=2569540 RepID=UPI0010AD6B8F|nr:radical SAM protein [Desulfosediminicola ganghwensis]